MKAGMQRDIKRKTKKKTKESGCLKKSHTPADDVAKRRRENDTPVRLRRRSMVGPGSILRTRQ